VQILRTDEKLNNFIFPELLKFDRSSIGENDALIFCAGFEDRTSAVFDLSIKEKLLNYHCITYLPHVEQNRYVYFKEHAKYAGVKIQDYEYDRQNPTCFVEKLFKNIDVNGILWIDISAMSRLLIVQIIEFIMNNEKLRNTTNIVYSEANEYPPSEKEFKSKNVQVDSGQQPIIMFLSSGIFDVTIVPELSSTSMLGQPVRLICFPSLSSQQLTALRSSIQPAYISIIHGVPPLDSNKWRTKAIAKINNIASLPNIDEYTTSTLDYRETVKSISQIYTKYSELERLVISPTGSKMQSVAVGIARYFLNDMQVVYPTPMAFTDPMRYTIGVSNIYYLPLSKCYMS
jgi:hypothetical protein